MQYHQENKNKNCYDTIPCTKGGTKPNTKIIASFDKNVEQEGSSNVAADNITQYRHFGKLIVPT